MEEGRAEATRAAKTVVLAVLVGLAVVEAAQAGWMGGGTAAARVAGAERPGSVSMVARG